MTRYTRSGFAHDADGWTAEVGGVAVEPRWAGSTDGFATPAIEVAAPAGALTWIAPAAYRGDLRASYGCRLQAQLGGAASAALVIEGNGDALRFAAPPGGGAVRSLIFVLDERSRVTLASTSAAPARDDLLRVLAAVTRLAIEVAAPADGVMRLGAVALAGPGDLDPMLAALARNLDATPAFDASTLTENGVDGGEVLALINDAFGVDAIEFDPDGFSVVPDPARDVVTVTGTAYTGLLGTSPFAATATFAVDAVARVLTIELHLALLGDWSFGTTFPRLAQTYLAALEFSNADDRPSYFELASRDRGETPAGLGVGGWIDLAIWPLAALRELIPGTPDSVEIGGPAIATEEREEIALSVGVGDFRLPLPIWPDLAFLGVTFTVYGESADSPYPVTAASLAASADVSLAGVALPFEVLLPTPATGWMARLPPGRSVPIADIARFLGGFVGIDLPAFLPEQVLALLSVFELNDLMILLDADRVGVNTMSVGIQTRRDGDESAWTILPGVLELRGLSFQLQVARQADGYRNAGWLAGRFVLVDTLEVGLTLPVPYDAGLVILTTGSAGPLPGLDAFARLLGGASLASKLPPSLADVGSFELDGLTLAIDAARGRFVSCAIAMSSAKPWRILPGRLEVERLYIDLSLDAPLDPASVVTGSVGGTFKIADVTVDLTAMRATATESWLLTVAAPEIPLPTLGDLTKLAGIDPAAVLPAGWNDLALVLYDVALDVDLTQAQLRRFGMSVRTADRWKLIPDRLEIYDVDARLDLDWTVEPFYPSGFIVGTVEIAKLPLVLSASCNGPGDWELAAQIADGADVPLLGLVEQLLEGIWDVQLPDTLLALKISELSFGYRTLDGSYRFVGGLEWKLDELPGRPTIAARLGLSRAPDGSGELGYAGEVAGRLSLWGLDIEVSYQFKTGSSALGFRIAFRGVSLACTLAPDADGNQILTANLAGVTFGSMLEWLVGLVDPDLGFRLSSPWDVLDEIRFDDLTLRIDLTRKQVGFTYRLDRDLGLIDIATIGLTLLDRAGTRSVDISITGRFLDTSYGDDDPLTWDLLNDPAPTPPGVGDQLLDLRYLGFGQNVAFRNTRDFRTVADVLAAVEADFDEPPDPDANPLPALPALKYTGDGRWILAADLTVMGTVSLAGVFNDPALYGIRVALAGTRAGSLAGLAFEILYRKVTDTIGVYHLELRLPDAMRQIDLGSMSITIPVIGIDVYTNGNFRIDVGFPDGLDFSRSFCVQYFPFIGYGGFYIAVLDGATSDTVPPIDNGTFSPVIELGLALSVGVGKTVDRGVLAAGVTVTVQGILEGTLAWFNPDDDGASSALYVRAQGTIAIVGKLYGKVDFAVVKAAVSVTAYASATMTVVAYEPVEIELEIGVEASVSIKIAFVRVHFSFEVTLDLSFTIGSRGTPPWRETAFDPERAPRRLRQQRTRYRRRPPEVAAWLPKPTGEPDWTPRNVFGGTIWPVQLWVAPAFTVARTDTLRDGAGTGVAIEAVLGLYAPNSIAPEARRAHDVREVAHDAPATFDLLWRGVLAWAFDAVAPGAARVTVGDLQRLHDDLAARDRRDAIFTYDRLVGFLEQNFVLHVAAPTGTTGGTELSSTVFPMVPDLEMTPAGGPPIPFWAYRQVSAAYEDDLARYFDELTPDDEAAVAGRVPALRRPSARAGTQSLATVMFRDYFAMLARGAVDAAIDLLASYPHRATLDDSLDSLSRAFAPLSVEIRAGRGDTLGRIAGRFGVSLASLRAMNPALPARGALSDGATVTVAVGCTPAAIAAANADYPLRHVAGVPVRMPVRGVLHQVASDDDLAGIARKFGLAGASSLFAFAGPSGAANPNAADGGLLAPSADLGLPWIPYTVTAGDVADGDGKARIAARFWVRNGRGPDDGTTAWYGQRIAELNPDNPGLSGRISVPIAEPSANGGLAEVGVTGYATAPGDVLVAVARAFQLVQLDPDEPAFAAFRDAIVGPVVAGATIRIPPQTHVVRAGESFDVLASLFGTSVTILVEENADAVGLLQPLAVVILPVLEYPIGPGETLGTVATKLDLSLDELADSVTGCTGIFEPYAGPTAASGPTEPMRIPDVAARDPQTLLDDLRAWGAVNSASAQVSRFLFHGLRVMAPDAPRSDPPMWGLYEMIGQQVAAPDDPDTGWEVTFRKGATAEWLQFGAADGPAGTDSLTFEMGPTFLAEHYPSPTFAPELLRGPTALPLYHETPPRYSLEQSVHWQSATVVDLPGPTATPPGASGGVEGHAGQPALWIFPSALVQEIADSLDGAGPTAGTMPYELIAAPAADVTGAQARALASYAWATAVPLRVRRAGAAAPHGYEVIGADEAGRDVLLAAWQYLADGSSFGDRAYLLYPPSALSANPSGLASDALDPVRTFVVQSNLSTVTHSNLAAVGLAGAYFASLDAPGPLTRLLWEASITGSGGFDLQYLARGGGGLPAMLFADGDEAQLWLVLLLGVQSRATDPDRSLFRFNNCAVLAENLDATSAAIYARLADPMPDQLERVAAVPPGTVGFHLARRNPDGEIGPEALTRSLYNLVGYQVAENSDFTASNQGLPVGPLLQTGDDPLERAPRPEVACDDPDVWSYHQVVPVYRVGKVNDTPPSPALPPAADNPYRGITGGSAPGGAPRSLSKARLALDFRDVFGNQTIATEPLGSLDVDVGYTDALIGLAAWPGTAADFQFAPAAHEIRLAVRVSLQVTGLVPGGGLGTARAREAAASAALGLRQVFYQVQQHDLELAIESNLGRAGLVGAALKAPMLGHVSRGKVFADTAARLRATVAEAVAGERFGELAARFAVGAGALAAGNATTPADASFADRVVRPALLAARPGCTLNALVAGRSSQPFPPSCSGGGCAGDGSSLTVEELAEWNVAAALGPGITLRTAARTAPLGPLFDRPQPVPDTLADVAAVLGCNVYAEVVDPDRPGGLPIPVGLVADNYTIGRLVAPDLEIRIGGEVHRTDEESTLASVHAAFAPLHLSTGDFAAAIRDVRGIFRRDGQVSYADVVVPGARAETPRFSLADLPAACGPVAELARANRAVTHIYATGVPVYLGFDCYVPQPSDTLTSIATAAGLAVEQLGAYNVPTVVRAGARFEIPALVHLTDQDAAASYASYAPTSSSTLASIAVRFGTDAAGVAAINRFLPGCFRPGAAIDVAGARVQAAPLDSLESVYLALARQQPGLTFDAFIAAIAGVRDLFAGSAAILTPLPRVPEGGAGESPAWDALAGPDGYHCGEAARLLEANRALEGFLREGASILGRARDTGERPAVVVGPHDTIDSVLRRLREQHEQDVTIPELARANGERAGLSTVGRPFLVPPPPIALDSSFDPVVPPLGATGEAAVIFPIRVTVASTRDPALVHPDFRDSGAVWAARSPLPPRTADDGDETHALDAFAVGFEDAFAAARLKCAVSRRRALGDGSGAPDPVWAVDFGTAGVRAVELDASAPQFYALRPLSTELVAGTLEVERYESGCGLCTPVTRRFDAVDLDAWMGQLLATVDQVLDLPSLLPALQQGLTGAGPPLDRVAIAPPRARGARRDGPRGFTAIGVALEREVSLDELLGASGCSGCTGATGGYGPDDVDALIAGKGRLARGLREDVVRVLDAAGATGGYYLESAREALYQQLLVRLSDAQAVTAVVQYPVRVDSPFVTPPPGASGPTPPRFSGTITPALYTITPGAETSAESLDAVAAHFAIASPFLAWTLCDVQGVLRDGATVRFDGRDQPIRADDTLGRIAARFGVPTPPTTGADWMRWTEFVAGAGGIGAQPTLDPRASFPVTAIGRAVDRGDTLAFLADYMDVAVESFARANQARPDLFAAGTTIEVPGFAPYVVAPGARLLDAVTWLNAHKLDRDVPDLTVDALAIRIRDRIDLLRSGGTVHGAALLPDVTLSTAKLSLGRVALTGQAPALTFLLGVAHASRHRRVFLNLRYAVNELEYAIHDVPGAGGYQASSWLTFVRPLAGGAIDVHTAIEQVQVPVPLRSYPTPPELVGQAARATHPYATEIAAARRWDYQFDFAGAPAEQDTHHAEVTFNHLGAGGVRTARTQALFAALATFIDASPQLARDLAILPTLAPGRTSEPAAIAVRVLATLVHRVADALSIVEPTIDDAWPPQTYGYRFAPSSDGRVLRELRLGIERAPAGAERIWPEVLVASPAGPTVGPDAGFVALVLVDAVGLTATYQYPDGIPADGRITQRLRFTSRDVIRNPNAWGGVDVTRNEDLIASGPLGPTGPTGAIETEASFLYRTPLVRFVDRQTPLLDHQQPIAIDALPGPSGPPPPAPRTIDEHLTNLLDAVLELGPDVAIRSGGTIELLCRYGYALNRDAGGEPILATAPIRLVPTTRVDGDTIAAFVAALADSLRRWRDGGGPSGDDGYLVFDLTVFAPAVLERRARGPASGGIASTEKPILRLEQLRLPMNRIEWNAGRPGPR